MSGVVSWLKPGWSGTVIGGFKPQAINQALGELQVTPQTRTALMQRIDAGSHQLALTNRATESEIRDASKGALTVTGQQNLLVRLTKRQDAATELAASMALGSAALTLAEPVTAILAALFLGVNALLATKSLITGR